MPKSFIQEFLDVLVLGFGTACTNCLQVETVVTIKPLIIIIIFFFVFVFFVIASACVFGHVGKIIQDLGYESGFSLVK